MTVTLTPISDGDAAGTYITQADVERVFGTDNVAIWSNLDNDTTEANTARIQRAIDEAEAEVVAAFRGRRYLIPFSEKTSGALLPVKDVMTRIAGVKLYLSRGTSDEGDMAEEEAGRLSEVLAGAQRDLMQLVTGIRRLDLVHVGNEPTAPTVVT